MKILSALQIRDLDKYTIDHEPISSIDLMERASHAFVAWFVEKFDRSAKVKVFCGPGNNGGDGLAIARILLERAFEDVEIFAIASEKTSYDYTINENRLSGIANVHYLNDVAQIPSIKSGEVVIDAIFGSGLTRKVTGVYAYVIHAINNSGAIIISVDIASGLYCDQNNDDDTIIQPDVTITFQMPKLSFLLPQNEKYAGVWQAMDIGLDKNFIEQAISQNYFLDKEDIKKIIRPRSKFAHKGNFGKSLLIAGSYGMMGAAVVATKACLRTGVGLSVSYIPKCGYEIIQTSVPENMVLTDSEVNFISEIPNLDSYTAIGVGPGIGKASRTIEALKSLLNKAKVPLVFDADALNILAEQKELLNKIPEGSILTPHPKELERLIGKSENDYQRLESLRHFAKQIKSTVILKGAHSAICAPDGNIYFNSTGNPGMATGGSGDVLTGIITSLLAQGYNSLNSAKLGVYLHGFAGDVAAMRVSETAMLASDIVEGIGEFFKEF